MNDDHEQTSTAERAAYFAGLWLHGLILGILLTIALFQLWAQVDDVRLFRYQNF